MKTHTPAATILAAAFAGWLLASAVASANGNPFSATAVDAGHRLPDQSEGKCGEGKCGGEKTWKEVERDEQRPEPEGKCGEGKCGGDTRQ